MKLISNILLLFVSAVCVMTACKKTESLPYYPGGTAPALTLSTTQVTATPADSNNVVLTLSWTNPKYAIDSSTAKYVVEIDSTGRNFSKAVTKEVTGTLGTTFTAQELNNILVGYGFAFDTAYDMDVRVISSYPNNNDEQISNVVTVKITPYAIPFALDATASGPFAMSLSNKDQQLETFTWKAPAYGGAKLTYALQYDVAGNNFAAAKTVGTDNDSSVALTGAALNSFAMNSGIEPGSEGSLEFRIAATLNGTQTVYSNVQTIQVTPAILVAYLYVAGDYEGWNPGAAPAIASTDGVLFEGYVNISTTGGFKLTSEPDWNGTNYGDGGTGKLSASGSAGNLNVPQAGYYQIKANLGDLTWTPTLTNWGIIGDATPNGWDSSTPLTFDATSNTWVINSIALTTGAFKFRANDSWDINYGADASSDKLVMNGGNISVPEAGNYKVVLDFNNPLKYTYTLTKL